MPNRQQVADQQHQEQAAEQQVRLPESRQQVIAEIVHMVRCLIERRQPAHPDPGLVSQLRGQMEEILQILRIQQKTEDGECKYADNSRRMPFPYPEEQQQKRHDQRIELISSVFTSAGSAIASPSPE